MAYAGIKTEVCPVYLQTLNNIDDELFLGKPQQGAVAGGRVQDEDQVGFTVSSD